MSDLSSDGYHDFRSAPKSKEENHPDHPVVKRPRLTRVEQSSSHNLPKCEAYERSYMHRDVISHLLVTKTQFLISGSVDGVIKFWKKTGQGIEFVKKFKTHSGQIEDMAATTTGSELASISRTDKTAKIFDIVNFDMINIFNLDFEPACVDWVDSSATVGENLIISDSSSNKIITIDARQSNSTPIRVLDHIHGAPVYRMRYNPTFKVVVSFDEDGKVKYWKPSGNPVETLRNCSFESPKTCFTKFQEISKETGTRIRLHNLNFSPDGKYYATTCSDRRIRIFLFWSGKIVRSINLSLEKMRHLQKEKQLMNNMDFARLMAIEMELDKSLSTRFENALFDQLGRFVIFPSMLGVKIVDLQTGHQVRSLGQNETNFRPLNMALFQGLIYDKIVRKFNSNSLESGVTDPTLFCSSYKKNRFYCFSDRNFEVDTATETETGELIKDRDIYNEKPTREEIMAAIEFDQHQEEETAKKETYENGTIHTTMGDIHFKLFPDLTPKTCENFCTHSRNGYYNGHIFHRVIKQFMIQTGDPTGTGTGGESIWDEDFDDEICDQLKHDNPFTLSMANCGPNSNGSQFFITVAPCPFLDRKHTIFGRVVKGMDVCLSISKAKTDPKTDKPFEDIKIINIKIT